MTRWWRYPPAVALLIPLWALALLAVVTRSQRLYDATDAAVDWFKGFAP